MLVQFRCVEIQASGQISSLMPRVARNDRTSLSIAELVARATFSTALMVSLATRDDGEET